MIAWVDIETTGLDPATGDILEVCIIVTDDLLNETAYARQIIAGDVSKMDEVVREMHIKSGLIEDLKYGCPLNLAEEYIIAAVGSSIAKAPMAGSSVHFDRAWLKHHMPRLESLFGYRNIDVSTVKELMKRWRPMVMKTIRRSTAPEHRADSDIRASIWELRQYAAVVLG